MTKFKVPGVVDIVENCDGDLDCAIFTIKKRIWS
jgi:hypothetical protein